MTRKADFNAEEWATVVEAPVLGGLRVVTASRGGKLRESVAMAKEYTKARGQQGQSELLDEIVASPPTVDASRAPEGGDIVSFSNDRLREAVGVIEAKGSPEDVEAYKRFVLSVAQAAAEAHKEGGFMGVGGKRVSEDEQAALDDIAATLGLAA